MHREPEKLLKNVDDTWQDWEITFDSVSDLILIYDRDGTLIKCNKTLFNRLNVKNDEIIGKKCNEILHECSIMETITTGKSNTKEVTEPCLHGIFVNSSFPRFDDKGKFNGVVQILRDITQLKRTDEILKKQKQDLYRSNAELEQFTYVVSHDLQEPLRKIMLFGEMLSKKCGETVNDEGVDYLKRIISATERLSNMVNSLLALSRITPSNRPFVMTDLTKTAREVLPDLEVSIKQTGGRVEILDMPTIEVDSLLMHQMLQNLIDNALKFHRPEATPIVKLSSRPVNNVDNKSTGNATLFYEITVEDNGIGFDEKYLDRIFKIFQRLHPRDKYRGTGTGLAICSKIAEHHGGYIKAESKPGEGSRFIVILPAVQAKNVNMHKAKQEDKLLSC